MSAAEEFRALHRAGSPLLLPNAWDYASAAALVDAGFTAIGTTSLGVAAAHGLPDGHGVTRAQTVALAHRLARLPCLFTVDIEAGFGTDPAGADDAAGVAEELAGVGAAGINLEDGRVDGTLNPVGEQVALIQAIRERVPDLFLNARVDTHWLAGDDRPRLAETVHRAVAYVRAGADGVFVPGLVEPEEIRAIVRAIAAPLNVLYLPGRHSVADLAALGVRRVSCGSLLFRAALHATVATARAVASGAPVARDIPSYAQVAALAAGPRSSP